MNNQHLTPTKTGTSKTTSTVVLAVVVVLGVITGMLVNTVFAAEATQQAPNTTPEGSDADSARTANTGETAVTDLPNTCEAGQSDCALGTSQFALVSAGPVDLTTDGVAEVTGDVVIPTTGADIEVTNSDLTIETDADGNIVSVDGTADVPLPTEGPLSAAVVVDGARAEVGYSWGRDLGHLGVPVNPDRQYFTFSFEDSFSMQTGFDEIFGDTAGLPVSLSAPGDVSVTMILDPLDPFLYIGGACPDFSKNSNKNGEKKNQDNTNKDKANKKDSDNTQKGELAYGKAAGEDCGLGVSLGGNLFFEAQTAGIASADLTSFGGHLFIQHSEIPLTTGVTLDGEMFVRIDDDSLAFGGNGQVRASVPLVDDVLDFSFPLADASTGMRMGLAAGSEGVDLFLSGSMDSQSAFDQLPAWLPLEAPVDASIEATARLVLNFNGGPLLDPASFVEIKGRMAMVPSYLTELTGVDLSELLVSEAAVRIDANGMRLNAKTTSSVHPAVELGGELSVDAFVSPANPTASYVALEGQVAIAAIDIDGAASLRLDSFGFTAKGHITTPVSQIELSGNITTTDVSLSGKARVEVPLNLLGDVLEGAPQALADAKEEVRKLDNEIQVIRDEIEANRAERTRDFDAAQAAVNQAKADVDAVQRDIDAAYRRISTLEREIKEWEDWYDDLPGIEQVAYGWASLSFEVGWRGTEIGLLYTGIGGLETARFLAQGVLDGAILFLEGVEAGLDLIPVDADPRIVALTLARETALGVLTLAEAGVSVLTIDARVAAEIDVTLGTSGLAGAVSGQVCSGSDCLELIGGSVTFAPTPEACFTVAGIETCLGF